MNFRGHRDRLRLLSESASSCRLAWYIKWMIDESINRQAAGRPRNVGVQQKRQVKVYADFAESTATRHTEKQSESILQQAAI